MGRHHGAALVLAGDDTDEERWRDGSLVAVAPEPVLSDVRHVSRERQWRALADLVAARRRAGGTEETGIAAALAYDADSGPRGERIPTLLAVAVDRALRLDEDGAAVLIVRGASPDAAQRQADELARRVENVAGALSPAGPLRAIGAPRTSLPRNRYLGAVDAIRRHIVDGDVYQANLCQVLTVPVEGDPLGLFERTLASSPAPRAAYLECCGVSLVSASPEIFLDWNVDGRIVTVPIKGTRARHRDPRRDRFAADELLASAKDRAELLMIVDLERNDLGRVCVTGSVRVPTLVELRSWATVHHLVSRVEGRLLPGADPALVLAATFPGGSITGAPKLRAMEILRDLEPVPRGLFTGSLAWFGDDGSTRSSILIRGATVAGGQVRIGAGGGVVVDSDPLAEWHESNHKARTLSRVVGFDPEEAR